MKKIYKLWFQSFVMIGIIMILVTGCKKKEDEATPLPLPAPITALKVSSITLSTAICGGAVGNTFGTITVRGVCWGTQHNPTIADNKTTDGSGDGQWESQLTGLAGCTLYYVRSYATNSTGTGYGDELSFTTQCKGTLTDIDGNVYNTITIGDQVWMTENLRVTHFNDGAPIPLVTDPAEWGNLSTSGFCWYNNDEAANKAVYGGLYNYYAITSGKLCPSGWHSPTPADWLILTEYIGGGELAGGSMKETGFTHWNSPNTGATNEFGFTALPGGSRTDQGIFGKIGSNAYWWATGSGGMQDLRILAIGYDNAYFIFSNTFETYGHSVRCVKD